MKYIVANIEGHEAMFVFPRAIDHDRMDEIIKENLTKLKELRRIREEFENIVTGVIL